MNESTLSSDFVGYSIELIRKEITLNWTPRALCAIAILIGISLLWKLKSQNHGTSKYHIEKQSAVAFNYIWNI